MPVKKVDKKTIIRESLNVFRTKGYHNTTMSDIATACGLLKGSIYHYFSSKEDLMKSVITYLHDWYNRNVFSIGSDTTLSGMEKLDKLTEISEGIFSQEAGGCLMANIGLETANVNQSFSDLIKEYFDDWIESLASIFREVYPVEEAKHIAELSVSEIEGSVLLMQVFQDKGYLQRAHQKIRNRYEVALMKNKNVKQL
jgi:AcrR family transcriptional regulator